MKFWDPPGNFTLVYEYQLKCELMLPLPPFVQYTLACLHVAPGQVTPNMLKQILGTGVLFRMLKQELPNCDEFNACWHMGWCAKKGSRGCVTMKSRGKFKVLVEDLATSTSETWRRRCFLFGGQWQEWHGHPFRVPGSFQRIGTVFLPCVVLFCLPSHCGQLALCSAARVQLD